MATIMLVAGSRFTAPLASNLKSRESLQVVHVYDSLVSSVAELNNSIINVDKLVYIQSPEEGIFQQDMQTLRDLLVGGKFFTVREIVFFVEGTPKEKNKYIESIMTIVRDKAAKSNGVIDVPSTREIGVARISELGFEEIYDGIMGIVSSKDTVTGRVAIYLKERGTEVQNSYEESEDFQSVIEPFNYKNIKVYDSHKESIAERVLGTNVIEEPEKALSKVNPKFTRLTNSIGIGKLGTIISGNPKTGASIMSVALSVSLSKKYDRVLLIDLSETCNAKYLLTGQSIAYLDKRGRDLLQGDLVRFENGVTLVDDIPRGSMLKFLGHLSMNIQRLECQCIVINVDRKIYEDACAILGPVQLNNLYTCEGTRTSIAMAKEFVGKAKSTRLMLYTSRDSYFGVQSLEPQEVKNSIDWASGVYAPIIMESLAIGKELGQSVLRV